MENYPDKKILAVIGAGHEEDLMRLIKKAAL
jgi:pheromone shutdown protein TraB